MDHNSPASGLVAAAEEVSGLAAKHAADADQARRLHPNVIRAVVEAGFVRHFVPARWGGGEGTFADMVAAVATIGEGCASAAWIASLTANGPRTAAYLPEEGQRELWGDGPDTFLVSALMPIGSADPVAGGWRLTGRWSFISAVDHSEWALVCGMAPTANGEQAEARYFLVPRAAYTIAETWFNVGMRGTGSNTLSLEDVFVPAHRSFARADAVEARGPETAANCYRAPLKAVNGLSFAAPILGAARGLLSAWSGWIAPKVEARADGDPGLAENASVYGVLARAAGEIDTAGLLLDRVARHADHGLFSPSHTALGARDCSLAAELGRAATDRIFLASGTSGQSESHAFQRIWRDVNSAASHLVLRFDPVAAAYARQTLAAKVTRR